MYSTVSSLHIALDAKVQQLNSNRKQAFHPEQYDMFLNDAVLTIIKQKSSAKLNSKQEGFEDSIKRYEDLQSLKRNYTPRTTFEPNSNTLIFELPSDYYSFDTLVGNVLYNRNGIGSVTEEKRKYVTEVYFEDFVFDGVKATNYLLNNATIVDTSYISNLCKSNKSAFYYFDIVRDFFKTKYDIDVYYETYDGVNRKAALYFVTSDPALQVMSTTTQNVTTVVRSLTYNAPNVGTDEPFISKGVKKIDLVSSNNDVNRLNDYFLSKNIHLNPTLTIKNDKGYIRLDNSFIIKDLTLEYIKKPRLIDSRINQMTDVTILDEVINLAAINILGILKDESFNIQSNLEQKNN